MDKITLSQILKTHPAPVFNQMPFSRSISIPKIDPDNGVTDLDMYIGVSDDSMVTFDFCFEVPNVSNGYKIRRFTIQEVEEKFDKKIKEVLGPYIAEDDNGEEIGRPYLVGHLVEFINALIEEREDNVHQVIKLSTEAVDLLGKNKYAEAFACCYLLVKELKYLVGMLWASGWLEWLDLVEAYVIQELTYRIKNDKENKEEWQKEMETVKAAKVVLAYEILSSRQPKKKKDNEDYGFLGE